MNSSPGPNPSPRDRFSLQPSAAEASRTLAQGEAATSQLADFDRQVEATLSGLSPDIRRELRLIMDSKPPLEAEHELLTRVVSKNGLGELKRVAERRSIQEESRLRDKLYITSALIALILLYCIFRWLYTGILLPW